MNIIGWVVAVIVIVGGVFYFSRGHVTPMSETPTTESATSSTATESTATTASVQGTSDINSITTDITAGANAEASDANSEDGTQDAAQVNSGLDSQTNNVQ